MVDSLSAHGLKSLEDEVQATRSMVRGREDLQVSKNGHVESDLNVNGGITAGSNGALNYSGGGRFYDPTEGGIVRPLYLQIEDISTAGLHIFIPTVTGWIVDGKSVVYGAANSGSGTCRIRIVNHELFHEPTNSGMYFDIAGSSNAGTVDDEAGLIDWTLLTDPFAKHVGHLRKGVPHALHSDGGNATDIDVHICLSVALVWPGS